MAQDALNNAMSVALVIALAQNEEDYETNVLRIVRSESLPGVQKSDRFETVIFILLESIDYFHIFICCSFLQYMS